MIENWAVEKEEADFWILLDALAKEQEKRVRQKKFIEATPADYIAQIRNMICNKQLTVATDKYQFKQGSFDALIHDGCLFVTTQGLHKCFPYYSLRNIIRKLKDEGYLQCCENEKQFSKHIYTVFRNQHGRKLFLLFVECDGRIRILLCFYTDREYCISSEAKHYAEPKKLKTREMPSDKLLEVIAAELDKSFAGIEYSTTDTALPLDDYLMQHAVQPIRRYRFLVMAGSDDRRADELPDSVCTILKNKLHRTVFLELGLYADGKGVVRSCYYCDREYRQDDRRVTPPSLVSCFFPYTRQGILELVNRELICDFTHIILTGDIDPKHCNSPICGNT